MFSPGMIGPGSRWYRWRLRALFVNGWFSGLGCFDMTGSGSLEDLDDFQLQVAFVETEVDGAVQPDLDGEFVARPDATSLTLGDLPLAIVVADREVVVDRAR